MAEVPGFGGLSVPFHSPQFLLFFVGVVVVVVLLRGNDARKRWLLAASYAFCAWPNPPLLFVLVAATLATYEVGRRLAVETDRARRRGWLVVGIAANVGLLVWFKYATFVSENAFELLRALGVGIDRKPFETALPIGISFYSLQAIGYTVDVYRRPARAASSLVDLALYMAFFPRLTAGPILRSAAFLPQLVARTRVQLDPATLFLFFQGLAKKVLIADNLSPFVNAVYDGDVGRWPSLLVWAATVGLLIQTYCDFSGYTDMAIAVARFLGYRLPPNFDYPFLARNPSDFWRRWHVSFSSWNRDYIYMSLPGSPRSPLARWRNTMITMFLAGLWHGASWGFALWGVSHGLLLVAHDAYATLRRRWNHAYHPSNGWFAHLSSIVALQVCVVLAMAFFGAHDLASSFAALKKMLFFDFLFGLSNMGLSEIQASRALLLMAAFVLLHLAAARVGGLERWLARIPVPMATALCVAFGFVMYCLWPLDEPPFIYQRF